MFWFDRKCNFIWSLPIHLSEKVPTLKMINIDILKNELSAC
jgi:hypothetical protein